mmetsp:Transcript_70441/g.165907  ORF Transcript_70441/g.165907 Transcript_70441/m.165907 type:complete len:332 (+) Transcript_70441:1059-2054(+)
MPRAPLIGVRISWLMLARKSLLAWLAASAATRARTRSTSTRWRSVTSTSICTTLSSWPRRSRMALALPLTNSSPPPGSAKPRSKRTWSSLALTRRFSSPPCSRPGRKSGRSASLAPRSASAVRQSIAVSAVFTSRIRPRASQIAMPTWARSNTPRNRSSLSLSARVRCSTRPSSNCFSTMSCSAIRLKARASSRNSAKPQTGARSCRLPAAMRATDALSKATGATICRPNTSARPRASSKAAPRAASSRLRSMRAGAKASSASSVIAMPQSRDGSRLQEASTSTPASSRTRPLPVSPRSPRSAAGGSPGPRSLTGLSSSAADRRGTLTNTA